MDDATAAACLPAGVAVTPGAAPRLAALPDPERDGLDALLALAARHPGRLQLAPDSLRLGWLAREYARWGRLAAAAVLVLAVSTGSVLEWRIARGSAAVASRVAERASLEAEDAKLATSLERRGVTLAEVATVPEAAQALARGSLDAAAALVVVGTGFAAQGDIVVNGVEMRAAALGEAAVDAAPGAGEAAGEAAIDAATAGTTEGATEGATDGTESCLGAAVPGAAMLVEFGLAEGLDARRRDAALGWVRDAADDLRPWRAGEAARSIGRRDAVVVSADRDEAHAAVQWALCLRREAGA
jgi:hypothetical protein